MSDLSKSRPLGMTVADLVLAAALAAVGAYLLVWGRAAEGATVVIRSSAGDTVSCGLTETRTVSVGGPRGETVVRVEAGQVRFIESPCPHKVCTRHGPVSRSGQWIACVPNGVVAVIEGKRDYDGITP